MGTPVESFACKLIPGGRVLDVGCGTGFLSRYLCQKGFHVTGIDFSEQMIALAKADHTGNADFHVIDFFDFSTSRQYDGLIAWDSFFHFPKEKQREIYTRAGSVLKQNGYLLFTHGDAEDEHTDTMLGERFYYSCLPLTEVEKLLHNAGFEIEYSIKDYVEKDTHRTLVVLAKKKFMV